MSKCKHHKSYISEEYTCFSEHEIFDGKYTSSVHDDSQGSYTGNIQFHCDDCGLDKKYTKCQRPKWLKKYLEQIYEFDLDSRIG